VSTTPVLQNGIMRENLNQTLPSINLSKIAIQNAGNGGIPIQQPMSFVPLRQTPTNLVNTPSLNLNTPNNTTTGIMQPSLSSTGIATNHPAYLNNNVSRMTLGNTPVNTNNSITTSNATPLLMTTIPTQARQSTFHPTVVDNVYMIDFRHRPISEMIMGQQQSIHEMQQNHGFTPQIWANITDLSQSPPSGQQMLAQAQTAYPTSNQGVQHTHLGHGSLFPYSFQ